MLLNQYDVERYIQVSADRGDLRVVWEKTKMPRTDGKFVYLPHLTMNTTADEAKELMWFATHEASHNVYTNFDVINDKKLDVNKSQLAALFNQLEDDGIDYINGTQFKGDRELCAEQGEKILNALYAKAVDAKGKGIDEQMPEGAWDKLMATLAFEADFRSDYVQGVNHLVDKFKDLINNKKESNVDKLLSGPYKDKLREIRKDHTLERSAKTYELAKQIFEEVFKGDAEKEEERLKKLAEQEGAEKGSGDGKDAKAKAGKSKGEESEGEGKGRVGGNKKGDVLDYSIEMEEIDYSQWSSDPSEFVRHEQVGGGQKVRYDSYSMDSGRNYLPCPLKDTTVVDYEKKTSNDSRIRPLDEVGGRVREHYEHTYRELAKQASDGFANKVRMLLQIRAKGKTQYGTKRGRLHASNLYRTTIKDAPGYNERVFKKRIEADILDTAVQIIVDDSGSMMGSKYGHAIVAAIHLSDTLGNTLHIPTEVLGFTEYDAKNCMFVFRGFDTKLLSKEKLLDRMIHAGRFSNQNADGDSVLFGYNRIVSRKEKRKVMIVLSDGSPAGDRPGDLPGFTMKVVQSIEAAKKVDIVGIGIMDSNVKRYYKDHQVISSADGIEPALLKLIQRKLV